MAAIIGAGESLNADDCDQVRRAGLKSIAINRSFELAPWADILYGCDGIFWKHYREALDFAGLKVTQTVSAAKSFGLHLVDVDCQTFNHFLPPPGPIASGGHGGHQAINLALQLGAKRILLLGFDAVGSHWHGRHELPLNNPHPGHFASWIAQFDAAVQSLEQFDAEIINCSPGSMINAFPKMTLCQALERH